MMHSAPSISLHSHCLLSAGLYCTLLLVVEHNRCMEFLLAELHINKEGNGIHRIPPLFVIQVPGGECHREHPYPLVAVRPAAPVRVVGSRGGRCRTPSVWERVSCWKVCECIYVTGSGKTRLLEQTKILVINVPSDRAEHCLHNDMLSVHIPSFIPKSCALETRSRKM